LDGKGTLVLVDGAPVLCKIEPYRPESVLANSQTFAPVAAPAVLAEEVRPPDIAAPPAVPDDVPEIGGFPLEEDIFGFNMGFTSWDAEDGGFFGFQGS
jgi:hypothetical protein